MLQQPPNPRHHTPSVNAIYLPIFRRNLNARLLNQAKLKPQVFQAQAIATNLREKYHWNTSGLLIISKMKEKRLPRTSMEVPRLLKVQRFLAVWYTGKLFGFLSTLASGLIITEIAPKALLRSDVSG